MVLGRQPGQADWNAGNCIKSSSNTKFLGLTIDDSLSWMAHIDQMMSKLNTTHFVIRMIQAIMSLETLRMVYFAYIHSITGLQDNQQLQDNFGEKSTI